MNPVSQIVRVARPVFRSLSTTTPAASAPKPIPPTGICFELSDEQKALQDLARKFTKEEITPMAAHYDKTGEYPWPIVKKAWEIGLMNGHVPEHCGGMELGVFDGCMVAEEIAFGCTGIMTAMEASGLGVSLYGTHTEARWHSEMGAVIHCGLICMEPHLITRSTRNVLLRPFSQSPASASFIHHQRLHCTKRQFFGW